MGPGVKAGPTVDRHVTASMPKRCAGALRAFPVERHVQRLFCKWYGLVRRLFGSKWMHFSISGGLQSHAW
jgi:hypothetical protein